ncbi:MAG: U32 family peptidase [Lachnospiraceae bacterium]|nr:U32 family peptidase [Lachnospiraceae bacterium]
MKKVELLAPAGNYEAFLGAIHAGADAVYLGGMKYSARAFADNFDEETLCKAISYAHLFGRKVYLTMNTLVKQSEFREVYSFLLPFYLEGLDGVIIQDMGVMAYIKRHFPLLEIHISTQMAITGPYGAKVLKDMGASRIVPARELSLAEMIEIKKQELEVETFVHGAMCYCYSGQCFFSSLLGGRSGNRGKCAQSCRLPYQVKLPETKKGKKKEEYPLSLKDLCSLELLPHLIEAGIDSFKIEGRMKRPEYAAGVTAIYRKYIDLYEKTGKLPEIAAEDWERLRKLYIRSEIQDGYYFRHNGPEMVTLDKPGYSGTDDALAEEIRKTYINKELKAEVQGEVTVKKGEPLSLVLFYNHIQAEVFGPLVEEAKSRALQREDIEKQLKKTGNTAFIFSNLTIHMDEDTFLPIKALNEIRREAFVALEEELTRDIRKKREESISAEAVLENKPRVESRQKWEKNTSAEITLNKAEEKFTERAQVHPAQKQLLLLISTRKQCEKACSFSVDIPLFVASDLLLEAGEELREILKRRAESGAEIWVRLPEVVRKKDFPLIVKVLDEGKDYLTGAMVSNMETYGYLQQKAYSGKLALNHHMYIWNQESLNLWREKADLLAAPLECNGREWEGLKDPSFVYLCYGRIPMMVTANCVRKTKAGCRASGVTLEERLEDRYGTDFPVEINCTYCYNVIYNSVPLSLHNYLDKLANLPGNWLRLDFTTESPEEMERIVEEYKRFLQQKPYDFSFLKDFTTGHYKKGAL